MFSGLRLRELHETFEDEENGLIFEKNVDIPGIDELPIRANVYRPLGFENKKFPVLVTYGPYGKDVHLK
jgi:predicted acyl esterase